MCKCGRNGGISIGGYCPDCLPISKGGTISDEHSEHFRKYQSHALQHCGDLNDPCPDCKNLREQLERVLHEGSTMSADHKIATILVILGENKI